MSSDDRTYYRIPVPKPILRLFSKVPLKIYPPNELPSSAFNRNENTLFIFTTATDASRGAPSFNPGCLKWQTLLKFRNIPFKTFPSNNHASPTGALPFLLPASQEADAGSSSEAVPSTKLHTFVPPTGDDTSAIAKDLPSLSPYHSLLAHPIRLAYLYALYLSPRTFTNVASPLYVESSTQSHLVHQALAWPLQAAALDEVKSASEGHPLDDDDADTSGINEERLLTDAGAAIDALGDLLGSREWYSGAQQEGEGLDQQPTLLDAGVFAYIHVILLLFGDGAEDLDSPAKSLASAVKRNSNLVAHRERILQRYYS